MTKRSEFSPPNWVHHVGSLVSLWPGFWKSLGNIETKHLEEQLPKVAAPIYITGLARAGTTITLELLAKNKATATHQYRDFPMLFTPYFWNKALGEGKQEEAKERAHKDRLQVTSKSPEAMEEMLWMHFFSQLHEPTVDNTLSAATENKQFEEFYRAHIRKLLLIRGGSRYLTKGNYNLTRLPYLLKLFPDAKFIVLYRTPEAHIASLMKQHKLFKTEMTKDKRVATHFRRVGHFEFGLDRRLINLGDSAELENIKALFSVGEEIKGWAKYWSYLYSYLLHQLESNASLRSATLLLSYDKLVSEAREQLEALYAHSELSPESGELETGASQLSFPTYYKAGFSSEMKQQIQTLTQETHSKLEAFAYDEK